MYNKTSDYIVKKLDLITNQGKRMSLLDVFQGIILTEDLFMNYIHGTIILNDGNDLHQTAPIIGEERIEFVYTVDNYTTDDVVKSFRVYRLESSSTDNPERMAHTLFIVSEEAYRDLNTSISKAYKNKSIDFIVRDAFKSISTNKLSVGQFSGSYHIVSPRWTPLQLINYTTSIARPKNYKGSLVFFYETTRGFEYKHIEELISQEPIGEWSAVQIANNDEPSDLDQITPSNIIESFTNLKNSNDTLKSSMEGLNGNTVLFYDNISKTYKTLVYNYDDNYKDTVHLNNYKLSSGNTEFSTLQKVTYVPSTNLRYNSSYYKSNMGYANLSDRKEEVLPWRNSMISQILGTQIQININGDSRLLVGKTINIRIPNQTALEKIRRSKHRYNTKKVLITKIIHTFSTSAYKMTVNVNSDSYPDDLNAMDVFARSAK